MGDHAAAIELPALLEALQPTEEFPKLALVLAHTDRDQCLRRLAQANTEPVRHDAGELVGGRLAQSEAQLLERIPGHRSELVGRGGARRATGLVGVPLPGPPGKGEASRMASSGSSTAR